MKQTDPLKFIGLLKWLDKRPMMDVLMPYQKAEIREAFWTFQPDGQPQYQRVLFGRGKKNAKTLVGVLVSLWLLLAWEAWGSRGNQLYYIASDQGQANDDLSLCKKIVAVNPVLKERLRLRANQVERKDGVGAIEVLAGQDVQGMHGKSYLAAVFDEFHVQRDYRVLEALELDRTRPDARQIFLTYASPYRHKGVPLVDLQKQHSDGTDPRLYVAWHSGTIEEANPSLDGPLGPTMEDILQAQRTLPSWIFRRLYLNLPGAPDGSAFDADTVERCVVKDRLVLPPRRGIRYRAFCDASGGGADDFTMALAHSADGQAVLDLVMDQGPRRGTFNPSATVQQFTEVLKQYGVSRITGDKYAGQWPRVEFAKHGIVYEVAEQTTSDLYAGLEPLLNAGRVELLDQPKLFQQLLGLIRKGQKIDHSGSELDDWAASTAGAISLVREVAEPNIRFVNNRPSGHRTAETWNRLMGMGGDD